MPKRGILSLCKDTARATEVTLQPLCRFELDAAILFSDILTVPDALDLGLYFETGEGPRFKKPSAPKQTSPIYQRLIWRI